MRYVLALDFGGTKLAVGLVDLLEERLVEYQILQAENDWEAKDYIRRMIALGKVIIKKSGINALEAVGISFGGPIHFNEAIVLKSQHVKGWANYPLRKIISDEFKLPTYLGNDGNLAALGEWRFGAGRGFRNLFYVQISTGIGSGIIIDNKLYKGSGMAAEFGHVTVKQNGLKCACGKKGCLESYSAGWAIEKAVKLNYNKLSQENIIRKLSGNDIGKVNAKLIFDAFRENDPLAKKNVSRAMRELGIAISNAICILDPEVVVLGGGITKSKDVITSEMFPSLYANTPPDFKNRFVVKFSELKGMETLFGAAQLANY